MPTSDAAKRASDIITTHILANNAGKWAAIKLHDGDSDGTAYDTRGHAIRHQLHPQYCMYIKIPLDGMPPEHAERLLAFHRKLYDQGFFLTDPEDKRHAVVPYTQEQFRKTMTQKDVR